MTYRRRITLDGGGDSYSAHAVLPRQVEQANNVAARRGTVSVPLASARRCFARDDGCLATDPGRLAKDDICFEIQNGCLDIQNRCFHIQNVCFDIQNRCFDIQNRCLAIDRI